MSSEQPKSGNIFTRIMSKGDFYKYTLVIEMLIIFTVFQILTKGMFLTTRNLSNLLMQGATCSIIAITMMFIIVSCNADLSAGAVLGFLGTFAAALQVNAKIGTVPTIIIILITGVVIGAFYGFWVAFRELPAFLVTLAGQLIFKGATLAVAGGRTVGPVNSDFAKLGNGYLPKLFLTGDDVAFNDTSLILTVLAIVVFFLLSIRQRAKQKNELDIEVEPFGRFILKKAVIAVIIFVVASTMIFYQGFSYAILILAVLGLLFNFVVQNTPFGRHVFAIGGNVEAARLSGINTKKTIMFVFILQGLVTAIASIVFLGRVGQATASAGTEFEFTAITGCVVGGTSISGGKGNILGAVIGTMLMASLDNGMSLLNLGATYQYIVKGAILLLAIALDGMSKKKG